VSQRRACEALGVDRTTVRYVDRRPDDAEARTRIRELAGQRRRFGYRRLHWLLCRVACCRFGGHRDKLNQATPASISKSMGLR
jgi:hypothetical protein